MCFVMDEVGGNISKKGDGHLGGKLLVCEKGMEPQKTVNTKDKHFTLLGLTALNGDPVMCICIFAGIRETAIVETGMDIFAEQEGTVSDADYLTKNKGPGKLFPGGPTCTFQGKEIPCLTRWSPSGSITAEILIDILATMDHYGVIDRSHGRKPFLLIDGHGSRFQEDFLKYVIDEDHEWVVCIGVPYGTALWQVGDSSEQNGSYKIALSKAKQRLIDKKRSKCMKLTIDYTDVIPLVNYAWAQSFWRVTSNKKAICDRGWNPLNRNLLLDSKLRSSMTEKDKIDELAIIPPQYSSFTTATVLCDTSTGVSVIMPTSTSTAITLTTSTAIIPTPTALLPTYNPSYLTAEVQHPKEYLNYSHGIAAFCLDRIVQNHDLMEARERIKNERKEGKSIEEMLKEQKGAFSAGKAFSVGLLRIGKTVFDRVTKHTDDMNVKQKKKSEAARLAMAELAQKAAEVKALGNTPDKLTITQIKTLLAPLKRKGDKALPTRKNELLTRLREWESREPLSAEEEMTLTAEEACEKVEEDKNENDGIDDDFPYREEMI